jgi:hypothetical protein
VIFNEFKREIKEIRNENDASNEEDHSEEENLDGEQNLGICLGCHCSLRQLD